MQYSFFLCTIFFIFSSYCVYNDELDKAYKILNLAPPVTEKDLASSYRALALKYHPDKNNSEEASQKMKEINNARSIVAKHLDKPELPESVGLFAEDLNRIYDFRVVTVTLDQLFHRKTITENGFSVKVPYDALSIWKRKFILEGSLVVEFRLSTWYGEKFHINDFNIVADREISCFVDPGSDTKDAISLDDDNLKTKQEGNYTIFEGLGLNRPVFNDAERKFEFKRADLWVPRKI
ncbi:DnaJ-domain-containing protein [Rozella allomycis CSF55]|uniref:DnaJ-domain-containing protein n=1 Tax=Rozella allomycis (strain CSF55) TaxID=988480 RepID=A0A4P9YKS1_ROZAC|nr:DnaJ-domain-containing protein [Rozella allomycis CSF55]